MKDFFTYIALPSLILCAAFIFVISTSEKNESWKVLHVYDGDTITVDIPELVDPLDDLKWKVRIRGIDTPERNNRAGCEGERIAAEVARDMLIDILAQSQRKVTVGNLQHDKYGGRIVADIYTKEGNVADIMIQSGYALFYDGGKKQNWCDLLDDYGRPRRIQ